MIIDLLNLQIAGPRHNFILYSWQHPYLILGLVGLPGPPTKLRIRYWYHQDTTCQVLAMVRVLAR